MSEHQIGKFLLPQEEQSYLCKNRTSPTVFPMDNARRTIAAAVEAGRNLAELSKAVGKNHAYLQQFMNRGVPRKLPEDVRIALAAALGVSETSLKPNSGASAPAPTDVLQNPPPIPGSALVGARDFPIYGAAQGGASGHLIIDFNPIQHVRRPAILEGVRNAYGIRVDGESMVPAFRAGDIALIHPHLLPEADTDVVLFDHDPKTGDAEALIKHLTGFTDKLWKLEQYNPAKKFSEHRADWPICHRVVGRYDRRR